MNFLMFFSFVYGLFASVVDEVVILQFFMLFKDPTMTCFKWVFLLIIPYLVMLHFFFLWLFCNSFYFGHAKQGLEFKVNSPYCSYSFRIFANLSHGIMVIL
jgi:hypothetical protein